MSGCNVCMLSLYFCFQSSISYLFCQASSFVSNLNSEFMSTKKWSWVDLMIKEQFSSIASYQTWKPQNYSYQKYQSLQIIPSFSIVSMVHHPQFSFATYIGSHTCEVPSCAIFFFATSFATSAKLHMSLHPKQKKPVHAEVQSYPDYSPLSV